MTLPGKWRIVEMPDSVENVPDRVEPAYMSIGAQTGPPIGVQKGPLFPVVMACPGSEQEGTARDVECPFERRSGARGRCLFAHLGKPGVGSGEG